MHHFLYVCHLTEIQTRQKPILIVKLWWWKITFLKCIGTCAMTSLELLIADCNSRVESVGHVSCMRWWVCTLQCHFFFLFYRLWKICCTKHWSSPHLQRVSLIFLNIQITNFRRYGNYRLPSPVRTSKDRVKIAIRKKNQILANWTFRNLIGQVDFFGTCLKDRSENDVIFTPVPLSHLVKSIKKLYFSPSRNVPICFPLFSCSDRQWTDPEILCTIWWDVFCVLW